MPRDIPEVFVHGRPWNEADYMALGETADQIELIDGALLVSYPCDIGQSLVRFPLVTALRPASKAANLYACGRLNIRLGVDRIANPDCAVIGDAEPLADVIDASNVALVGEIVSATTAVFDRLLKRQLYAEARIGFYLLIQPDLTDYKSVSLRLLRLDGERYVDHAVAKYGETLLSEVPFPMAIDTRELLEPRVRRGSSCG